MEVQPNNGFGVIPDINPEILKQGIAVQVEDITTEMPSVAELPEMVEKKEEKSHLYVPGHDSPGPGRPKGETSLTQMVRDALKKPRAVKDPKTGEIKIMSGEELFSEVVLELALKNKDRESVRMIWEHTEGKPTQQHKIDMSGPKGYEIDPERERRLLEEFSMVVNTPVVNIVVNNPEPQPETKQIEAKPSQPDELQAKLENVLNEVQ